MTQQVQRAKSNREGDVGLSGWWEPDAGAHDLIKKGMDPSMPFLSGGLASWLRPVVHPTDVRWLFRSYPVFRIRLPPVPPLPWKPDREFLRHGCQTGSGGNLHRIDYGGCLGALGDLSSLLDRFDRVRDSGSVDTVQVHQFQSSIYPAPSGGDGCGGESPGPSLKP